eukprot:g11754.t1
MDLLSTPGSTKILRHLFFQPRFSGWSFSSAARYNFTLCTDEPDLSFWAFFRGIFLVQPLYPVSAADRFCVCETCALSVSPSLRQKSQKKTKMISEHSDMRIKMYTHVTHVNPSTSPCIQV